MAKDKSTKSKTVRKRRKAAPANKNKIRAILKVATQYEALPIRNYRILAPLVPCTERCLEMHFKKGREDAEAGKTRTFDFRFFRIIKTARTLAYLAAVSVVTAKLHQEDAGMALKYLAITDRKYWSEVQRSEVKAEVKGLSQVDNIDMADKMQAEKRRRFAKVKETGRPSWEEERIEGEESNN